MSKLKRSLLFSFAGKYSSMLLQFVSVMVISRVLTPDDLGGFSLALGSVAVGQVLRDFGLSLYLVKEKEISDDKVQGCFTISIFICWFLALVYFISAPYIGGFFEKDSIETLTKILALNFLIIPFGTFTLSLLKREMKFDKIMYIDVLSAISSTTASVVLILMFGDVEVLAIASVLGTLTTVLMSLRYTSFKYFRINLTKIKEIASFSAFVSGANILNELRSVIPEFLIGKYSSVADVAYLSKANGTINLFAKLISGVITPVLQPYIAKIHNEKGNIEKELYLITHYMLVFQWPFCSFVFVYAEEIIMLLYGPQWEVAIGLLKICCVLFLIDGLTVLGVQLLNSAGDVKYVLNVSIVMTLLRVLFVLLFVDLGLFNLVLTFIVLALMRALLLLYRYKTFFNISFSALNRVYLLNLMVAISTLAVSYMTYHLFISYDSYLLRLALAGPIFGLAWITAVYSFNHPVKLKVDEVLIKAKLKKSPQ